ncbi:MAG TPA: hypothetical protein VIJ86_05070 [Acidimicrobiales bacterium]
MSASAGMGLALGWRPHTSPWGLIEFLFLVLLGLFPLTWFGVLMGMIVKSSDAMLGIGFAIVSPLSFLAGPFVTTSGMKTIPRVNRWVGSVVGARRGDSRGHSGHWGERNVATTTPGGGHGGLVLLDHRDLCAPRPTEVSPVQLTSRLSWVGCTGGSHVGDPVGYDLYQYR